MRVLDKVVLVLFVIALIVLCFLQQCSIDKYVLVFGFAIAVMSGIAMYIQDKNAKKLANKQ